MTDPSTRQVGGDHYLKLKIQPFDFSLANGWDGASHTILKYVSRHHNVEREEAIESLRKAYHIVEIIQKAMDKGTYINTALLTMTYLAPSPAIPVSVYCYQNSLDDLESLALQYLQAWLHESTATLDGEVVKFNSTMVKNAIEDILINRYGVNA